MRKGISSRPNQLSALKTELDFNDNNPTHAAAARAEFRAALATSATRIRAIDPTTSTPTEASAASNSPPA